MGKLMKGLLFAGALTMLLAGCGNKDAENDIFANVENSIPVSTVESTAEAYQPSSITDLVMTCNIDGDEYWGVKSVVEDGGTYNVHRLDDNVWATSYGTADVIGDTVCDVLDVLYETENGITLYDAWGDTDTIVETFVEQALQDIRDEVGEGDISDVQNHEDLYYQTMTYEAKTGPQSVLVAIKFNGEEEGFHYIQLKLNSDMIWINEMIELLK